MPASENWLQESLEKIRHSGKQSFIIIFSLATRKFSKAELFFTEKEKNELQNYFPFFYQWNQQNLARIMLLLEIGTKFPDIFKKGLNIVFSAATIDEQSFLLRVLPYLPFPEYFLDKACEGVRSNSTTIFDSIVLDNPYPEIYMPEQTWNQMVLKAVFTGRPLYRIKGLDNRMNKDLSVMLKDLLKERSAAGRKIAPETWRLLSVSPEEDFNGELLKLFKIGDKYDKIAAFLASNDTEGDLGSTLLKENPALVEEIRNRKISWDILGQMYADELERKN